MSILIAYDAAGNVIATLDSVVASDDAGHSGFVVFEAHEDDLLRIWHVSGAAGSKVWPDRIDNPHDYRVELEGPPGRKRIRALVHRETGERRG